MPGPAWREASATLLGRRSTRGRCGLGQPVAQPLHTRRGVPSRPEPLRRGPEQAQQPSRGRAPGGTGRGGGLATRPGEDDGEGHGEAELLVGDEPQRVGHAPPACTGSQPEYGPSRCSLEARGCSFGAPTRRGCPSRAQGAAMEQAGGPPVRWPLGCREPGARFDHAAPHDTRGERRQCHLWQGDVRSVRVALRDRRVGAPRASCGATGAVGQDAMRGVAKGGWPRRSALRGRGRATCGSRTGRLRTYAQ